MGNYITKKKALYTPLISFDHEFYENINTHQMQNYINLLKEEIKTCIEKTDKLNDITSTYKNNIYTINEQIDLINKDLTTLLQNDKCLLNKNNIIEERIKTIEDSNKNYISYEHNLYNNNNY